MPIPAAVSRTFRGRLETSDDRTGPRRFSVATAQHLHACLRSTWSTVAQKNASQHGARPRACEALDLLQLPCLGALLLLYAFYSGSLDVSIARYASRGRPSPELPRRSVGDHWCRRLCQVWAWDSDAPRCGVHWGRYRPMHQAFLGRTTKEWVQKANQKRCLQ